MKKTPKSLRLHIGLFGRTNVGKSSFLNMVANQAVSITSKIAGTTTDVVQKTMELLPIGPVVFLDTAGLDDLSQLAQKRLEKTNRIFNSTDIVCLIVEGGIWGDFEEEIVSKSKAANLPLIGVINKTDKNYPDDDFMDKVSKKTDALLMCNSLDLPNRDIYINKLKSHLLRLCSDDFLNPPPIVGDLLPTGGVVVLIIPIDFEAPKGRIILPQVQTIRDALDSDSIAIITKESEYKKTLSKLKAPPDLVVCDSQVVDAMVADTLPNIKCTTFSILFSRFKGDLQESVRGVGGVDSLKKGDKVLIAESCSHHAIEDDIGRVKIPKWLNNYVGQEIAFDTYAGLDYPQDLQKYKLIIHCGGCMTNRREMLWRIDIARQAGVAITNYGVLISYIHGVLGRVLTPFPKALSVLQGSRAGKLN